MDQRPDPMDNAKSIADVIQGLNLSRPTGIVTGFPRLDFMTGGFQKGDLVVIAGQTCVGKSSLGMNIVSHSLFDDRSAYMLDLEMNADQTHARFVAHRSGVEAFNIMSNRGLTDDDHAQILAADEALAGTNLYINNSIIRTPTLRERIVRTQENTGLAFDLIFVDCIDMLAYNGFAATRVSQRQEMLDTVQGLKSIATDLNVLVLATTQISMVGREPQLSDLRGDGVIAETADTILFLYADDMNTISSKMKVSRNLVVAKQRNRNPGSIKLLFNPSLSTFYDER